jgi:hypothetical protein
MKSLNVVLIFCWIGISSMAQVIEHTYDFNDLEIGDLDGQDDWHTILQTSGTADLFVDIAAGNVTAPDGSQAVFYNASGAGYGRTATRKATSNFDFDFTSGGIIEIEVEMHRNWWGMFFGAGFDADGDGHIAPGLISEEYDGGVFINISSQNPDNNKIVLPDGNSVVFTADNEEWATYKMVLDFTANSGEGAAALFYKPGASGDDWLAISEVQGVNMGMTPGSGDKRDYMVWDGIFFHSQGGTGGFDNILIRQPENLGLLQFIDFEAIPNKLTTSPAFDLSASATSGLEVDFEVVEGPASINGNTVTLSGDPGMVTIKASQAGDATWAPAPNVFQTFEVVDPTAYSPDLTVRRPADDTKVYMTELSPVLIVASAYIEHPEVLTIESVNYTIGGQSQLMTQKSWKSGYFSAQWTPPGYGTYTMSISANSTGGMNATESVTFEVTDAVEDLNIETFDMVHISTSTQTSVTQDFDFPTYAGAFGNITLYLDVTCPAGGCDPWDRVGNMEARGPDGEWVELLRYITPYGVPCDHTLDASDYASILQGKVELRFSIGTNEQGFVVDVNFDFQTGTPEYKYSWVDVIWNGTFPFGDYADLQPMDTITWNYDEAAEASRLKIINTGHGWGDLNTGNAAEFYDATHTIKVNDQEYDQHLWVECNPNPDGCQPQNGTWFYDRAGWCPGSISEVYEYDLSSFVGMSNVEIIYEFYPAYVDLCHPNHPDCVTGVTCSDCNAGFNPHYIISGNLVSYSNSLFITTEIAENPSFGVEVYPNPAVDEVHLSSFRDNLAMNAMVGIYDGSGRIMTQFEWNGDDLRLDVSEYPQGIYFISVTASGDREVVKLVIE